MIGFFGGICIGAIIAWVIGEVSDYNRNRK